MSMNPARTFGPALLGRQFDGLWIYFVLPPLGMVLAAELFRRRRHMHAPGCAKLNHSSSVRCIFCGYEPRTLTQTEDVCITT